MADVNNNDAKIKFRVMSDDAFKTQIESYDTKTITITNRNGTISTDYEQGSNMYVGGEKIGDIVVINDIPGIEDYTVELINNELVITPNSTPAPTIPQSLGNPNKLYIWFNSSEFNIFVYNPINQKYMAMGNDIVEATNNATRGITRSVTLGENPINYVTSEADINNPSAYVPKTLVYFPQS